MRRLRHPVAAVCGLACAASIGALTGNGTFVGGGVATACAQVPTVPTEAIPTVGPVDPACSRVPDTDNDNVFDYEDNCNGYFNPSQRDTDNDSGPPPYEPVDTKTNPRDPSTGGDTCDTDDDGDAIQDVDDNCQKVANKDQADGDNDGIGDKCDEETTLPAAPPARGGGDPAPSGGGGGAAGGGGQSTAPARPVLTVLGPSRRLRLDEIRSGIAIPVRCSAACIVRAEAAVDRRTARRMKVRGTTLGRGIVETEAPGLTFVFVRLTKTTLARAARARTARVTLRLTVADSAGGNRATATRRITLRR